MRSETVFEVTPPGFVIALYSESNSLELFYLCKVIDVCVVQDDITDEYGHFIRKTQNIFCVTILKKKNFQ